jgi:hypothetical protein
MPAIPVQDMISSIRDLADDVDKNVHSDAELLRFINGAVAKYDGMMALHARRILMQHRDVTHDGSELQAVMPYLPRIISVERTSDTPRTETRPLNNGFSDRFGHIQATGGAAEGFYYVQNNQLAVVPQQASGTDRVWVVLRSPELHYGTAQSGATTTSLVMASSPTLGSIMKVNDAYNAVPFMLTVTREVGVINDFTGSSVTGTLQFTLENSPASAVYSILPTIDPEFHWLYIYQALIMARIRTDESNVDPASERKILEGLLLGNVTRFQTQRPRYMQMTGW